MYCDSEHYVYRNTNMTNRVYNAHYTGRPTALAWIPQPNYPAELHSHKVARDSPADRQLILCIVSKKIKHCTMNSATWASSTTR